MPSDFDPSAQNVCWKTLKCNNKSLLLWPNASDNASRLSNSIMENAPIKSEAKTFRFYLNGKTPFIKTCFMTMEMFFQSGLHFNWKYTACKFSVLCGGNCGEWVGRRECFETTAMWMWGLCRFWLRMWQRQVCRYGIWVLCSWSCLFICRNLFSILFAVYDAACLTFYFVFWNLYLHIH